MSRSCIWCGAPLPAGSRRSRRYCSGACRVAALRQRRAAEAAAPLQPLGTERGHVPSAAHPDDQVAAAVLEARGVANAFLRLGLEARPQLAWRCEGVGGAMAEALRRFFPELEV